MSSDPFDFDGSAQAGPPAREDEDLFAFDQMLQSKPNATRVLEAELGAALGEVESARDDVLRASAHARVGALRRAPRIGTPRTRTAPVARSVWAPSRVAIGLVAAFVAINFTTSVLAWRSAAGTREVLADLGERLTATTSEMRAESARDAALRVETPAAEPRAIDDGFGTIANARTHIERGEFERARRLLGGLLAVIDRFDAARRAELEAQAGFVIAESYQRQALLAQRVGADQ